MAQKANPVSLRIDLNRKQDSSWFADFNYTKIMDRAFGIQRYLGTWLKQRKKKGYKSSFRSLSKDRMILQILPLKIRIFPFIFSTKKKARKNKVDTSNS